MRFRRGYTEEPEVNLIPLIDVLLVVLIFLAVSTTYSRFSQLQIKLPKADPDQASAKLAEIEVGVTADGRFAIGHDIVPVTDSAGLAELLRAAAAGMHDPILVINADAQSTHQSVITVMEAARNAGLTRLSFATRNRSGGARR